MWRNLAAGGLAGELYAVNPKHRTLYGQPAYPRLSRLPKVPDLAVLVTPARTVPQIIADAGAAGIKAAVVLSSGFAEAGEAGRALQEKMIFEARRHGVRILGPNCLGVMRTDTGLNATFVRTPALPGALALVSQSGAICGALLDWAHSAGIGFTSVVSLGAAADVDFGEILDFLVADQATEAVLLYIEGIRNARRYLSALRAAGGVRLNLQNPDMLASAYDDMMRHVRALRPTARIEGAVVQPMLRYPHAREVLVGVATDPVFGPVISFGAGGVTVEAVRDTALAPG